MRITVPSTVPIEGAMFPYTAFGAGLCGLGDDGTVDLPPDTPPAPIDTTPFTPPPIDPAFSQQLQSLALSESTSAGIAPSSSQLQSVIQNGTSTGLSPAQIAQIVSSAANAGVAVFRATSAPSLIPGTNLVYNPATGQVANASTGLTGGQIASVGLGGLSFGTLALLMGAGLFMILLMDKR